MVNNSASPSLDPRAAALDLIEQVLETRSGLAEVLGTAPASFAKLPPEGRARAQRLALAAFRTYPRADHLLRKAMRKTPPEAVLWILRLAVVEMLNDGAAAHGVINDAVSLTRNWAQEPKLTGLVNAVLRQMADHSAQDWDAAPVPRLPSWLRGALQNAFGAKVTADIEAAHLRPAPIDLTLKGPRPEGLPGVRLPTGSLRVTQGVQVTALPGFAEGAWWVQDAAASLPAQILAPKLGERVLDLCAAPGGKTMQMAAMGADVTALDMSGPRMARLTDNLSRTGLRAQQVVADALHWRPEIPFDAILLDAPCSATGTIRRHPELPLCRDREQVRALVKLQAALLDRALDPAQGLLKAGGRVLYCTCSLLPEEGEDQARVALSRHPAQRLVPIAHPDLPAEWATPEGGLRTRPDFWPDQGGLDGFYIALFQHVA